MKVTLSLVVLALALAVNASVDDDVALLNTREDAPNVYNQILVGPLDSQFYGLAGEEDEEEGEEPMGDVDSDIEDILDDQASLTVEEDIEEVVEEMEEDDDADDEDINGRRRNRRLWKKLGRKSSRKVSRFMHRRNLTDIDDVPPRKFRGKLSRMHRQSRRDHDEAEGRRRPMKRLYKKVTKKVNKRMSQEKFEKVCEKVSSKHSPRRRILNRLPVELREEFTEMFNNMRNQLSECCQMEEDDKRSCFAETHFNKMDQLCTLNFRQQQLGVEQPLRFKYWQMKASCCEISDVEERQGCFREAGSNARKEKRRNKKKRTPEDRARAVCRKVDGPIKGRWFSKLFSEMDEQESNRWKAIFQQRRNDMKGCCEHQDIQDTLTCAEDLKEQRYDRVCAGQETFKPEPRYNERRHGALVDTCCQLDGAPRYQCFNTRGRDLPDEDDTEEELSIQVEVDVEDDVEDDEEEEVALEDMMMGDAPMGGRGGRRGRRPNRNGERSELRRVKSDCCEQGRTQGETFPNDGKAIVMRQEQCPASAEVYAESFNSMANLCKRIYKRCCLNTGTRPPCLDADGDGECDRRQNRRGRRRNKKVHMNVQVDGNIDRMDEIIEEVDKIVADVSDQN